MKINKIVSHGVAVVAMLSVAAVASAASIPNIKFDNGQTTRDCTAGQSVNFVARITVPAGEVVEKVQVDVISDSLAPELAIDVGGDLGLQEGQHDVNLVAPCPQNTGYYTTEVRTSGVFGGMRSNSITDGVTSVASFGSSLRVVATNSGSTGSTGIGGMNFADLVAALKIALGIGSAPAPTTTSEVCKAYAQANAGTQPNVNSDANVRLQGFLLSQGASIPALKAGASFGFYGNQTTAAVGWFNSLNHCQ